MFFSSICFPQTSGFLYAFTKIKWIWECQTWRAHKVHKNPVFKNRSPRPKIVVPQNAPCSSPGERRPVGANERKWCEQSTMQNYHRNHLHAISIRNVSISIGFLQPICVVTQQKRACRAGQQVSYRMQRCLCSTLTCVSWKILTPPPPPFRPPSSIGKEQIAFSKSKG